MSTLVRAVPLLAAVFTLAACGGDGVEEGTAAGRPASAEVGGLDAAVGTAAPVVGGAPVVAGEGITVTGSGSAKAVPDAAEWSFGVQSDAGTAEEALQANSTAMKRVLAALREAGLRGEDLRTEQVSVYPRTSPDGSTVDGYTATNSVHAVVHDLAEAGTIVDRAAAAGANQVHGPMLRLEDSREQYRAAVEAAYEDALARAEAIAAQAGLELGVPVAIVESGGGAPSRLDLPSPRRTPARSRSNPGSRRSPRA